VLPIGLALPSIWLTEDVWSFLAGFLAVGITVAGFLTFGWRWLAPYLLVSSAVALVLLLAPDTHAAFGLIFLVLTAVGLGVRASGTAEAALWQPSLQEGAGRWRGT
jgi:hypothetical protein